MDDNPIQITGRIPEIAELANLSWDSSFVPLTIQDENGEKVVIGEARVTRNRVEAIIFPSSNLRLSARITEGVVKGVSLPLTYPHRKPGNSEEQENRP